jgi:hypothetical protein
MSHDVSDLRIQKHRARAALTLATGATIEGCFFLSGCRAGFVGPERVADLLNAETGFFPFECDVDGAPQTLLFNRSQVVDVRLLEGAGEARLDPGYVVATEQRVRMVLSIGRTVEGAVRIYRPKGKDRLSDYTRAPEVFRYVETPTGTVIVNSAHIVELRET